jgi:hypothetical protein
MKPRAEMAHRVMWSLEMLPEEFVPEWALNAPDGNMFRLSFPDEASAQQFVAEIQRFMGAKLLHLFDEGIELKVKAR